VQSALIAEMNVKFRSNLIPADQSIVEIVGQREDGHVVSVTRRLRERAVFNLFFSTFFKQQKLQSPALSRLIFRIFCFKDGSDTPWIKVIR
jgi:hypothetical protein